MSKQARNHRDLEVYQRVFAAAMQLHELSRKFPREEQYSLTDQMRRASRFVCSNLAEAWRKRRYEAHFISKLSDAEAEAAETQVWIEFAVRAGYLERATAADLYKVFDRILGTLVGMVNHPETWILQKPS